MKRQYVVPSILNSLVRMTYSVYINYPEFCWKRANAATGVVGGYRIQNLLQRRAKSAVTVSYRTHLMISEADLLDVVPLTKNSRYSSCTIPEAESVSHIAPDPFAQVFVGPDTPADNVLHALPDHRLRIDA